MVTLLFHSVDKGRCRIYYRDQARQMYAFQHDFPRLPELTLYECTAEGEPSHPVAPQFTLDKVPPADCPLTATFETWLAKRDLALFGIQ